MKYRNIDNQRELEALCGSLRDAAWIAFDTEFVAEYSYYPQLCLLQVASDDGLAIVDPLRVRSLDPFWEMLATGRQMTIVHAGREELAFCQRAVSQIPAHWFDVQLASGFLCTEYPASYHKLVHRWLARSVHKGETRTDWRRRPLTHAQIDYALTDVVHLKELSDRISSELTARNRYRWFEEETAAMLSRKLDERQSLAWRRIKGTASLRGAHRAVAAALCRWREQTAIEQNRPPQRILRDDLLVEIARRGISDPSKIMEVRGMRRELKPYLAEICRTIESGREGPIPEDEPSSRNREYPSQVELMGQLLSVYVGIFCRDQELSPILLATSQELRDFIAENMGIVDPGTSRLGQSWRADLIGHTLHQLLAGELCLRIVDPRSDTPLVVEPTA